MTQEFNVHFQENKNDKKEVPPINMLVEGGIGDAAISAPWLDTFKKIIGKDTPISLYARYPKLLNICLPWAENKIKTYEQCMEDKKDFEYLITVTDMIHFTCFEKQLLMPAPVAVMFQNWFKRSKPFMQYFNAFPKTAPMFYKAAIEAGYNRNTFIFYQTGLKPVDFEYQTDRPKDMPEKCLVINDGFSTWHKVMRVTKCWDLHHWDVFLREFKEKYPDIVTVQVGNPDNTVPMRVDINLIGKTTLQELIGWVNHADYYLGNDSGPVHIRHWSKKPSVVMFGPSPENYYGYPENINLAGDICYPCYWQREDWNEICKLEKPGCLRMQSITPKIVMEAVERLING